MLDRSWKRGKPQAQSLPPAHRFDALSDFCTECGAHRSSVWLALWPSRCPAGDNVVGISHLLARRHLAALGSTEALKPQSL
jgi:hypothetical protein